MKNAKPFLILFAIVLLSGVMYLLAQYIVENFFSDAATRLAYQIRDEAGALIRSGASSRSFKHFPRSWPEGMTGDYRVEITETKTGPASGHRSIGLAPAIGSVRYSTSYHLNFVEVPRDLVVTHRKGEPTTVTLEKKDGKVLLTGLQ